ncbi:hypothetical protein [Pseudomonas anguilliseptica]|uniref:hypothetical protein n=1 Tax=Pseudomonas anguilliseptica TaxID=53406 RepID=UPI003736C41E
MRRSSYSVLLAALLGGLPCAGLLEAEELGWDVVPIPGVVNVRDDQPVDGLLFEVMQLLAARLPELQMRYEILPLARIEKRMGEKGEKCSSGLLQTSERNQLSYFVPFVATTPMHVLVRRQSLGELRIENGQVSLDWLLGNPYLRGALAKSRVYPASIRERLLQAHAEGDFPELGGSQGGENLLLMVSHHRLDYVFDYPVIYTEVMRHFSLSDALVSVPLRENAELVTVGIYCPRTPWGARMAGRLDQAIRELSATPVSTLAIYQRWLPLEVYSHYHEQLLAFFAQRASAAPLLFD